MKGLIIRVPWINYILEGKKIWEIRGKNTKIRERIGLIQSQSGLVVGEVDLVDCLEITFDELLSNRALHQIPRSETDSLPYKKTYAWVLKNPIRYAHPKPYHHPQGAVIWVNLDV